MDFMKKMWVRISLGGISILAGGSMFYLKYGVKQPAAHESVWMTFFNMAGLYLVGGAFFMTGIYLLITSRKHDPE